MSTESGTVRQADRLEKRFGDNLRRLREGAGLSQARLANQASGPMKRISKTEVNQLEAGARRWMAIHAFIFADALGCTPGELLDVGNLSNVVPLDFDGEALSPREAELLRHLRSGNTGAALSVMSTLVASGR